MLELAKEQRAHLDLRAQEALSLSTMQSDSRQVAALQLSKSQTDLQVEEERTLQLNANIEVEKTRVCGPACVPPCGLDDGFCRPVGDGGDTTGSSLASSLKCWCEE